jgi:hypothetical protein
MAVSRRRRWVVAVVVGLLSLAFGVVVYALHQLNQSTKAVNTQSHVAALNHALRQYFNDHTDWADANTRAGAGEWVVVDRQTTRRLLADVSGRYGADPVFADDLTVDAWHRPLRLELSRDRSGRVLHRITSFGPDGIQGTSDDLTFSSDVFAAASTRPS